LLVFNLVSDPEGKVASLYGVLKTSKCGGKTTVSARRVTFIIASDGRVAEVLENVRPAEKHADLALEAVKKLTGSG
jgi:peroxiredoxin Q/BCP